MKKGIKKNKEIRKGGKDPRKRRNDRGCSRSGEEGWKESEKYIE